MFLKNLNLNEFLTKLFDTNPSIYHMQTNFVWINLERLWFYNLSLKILFLVSCCHFCSFFLTEYLTGLHRILTSDWLHVNYFMRTSRNVTWVRKSTETNLFCLLFQVSLSYLSYCLVKKLEASYFLRFLHSHLPTRTTQQRFSPAKSAQKGHAKYIYPRENAIVKERPLISLKLSSNEGVQQGDPIGPFFIFTRNSRPD